MNLDTLTITPAEAEAGFAEYRGRPDPQDRAIAAVYKAAQAGDKLIELSSAIHRGGYHPNGLPRLAVARAGSRVCWAAMRSMVTGSVVHSVEICYADWQNAATQHVVGVRPHTVTVQLPLSTQVWAQGTTMVPPIPPRFRPKRALIGPDLGAYHVLWEVEQWTMTPSRDPALIQHVAGDVWKVLAEWDLTPLERAAITGMRARS
jgi:hypothetical protein